MDAPPNWTATGDGLANLCEMFQTPEVLRVLATMAQQMRHMGFEKGLPDLFALERTSRAQVSRLARQMTQSGRPIEPPPLLDAVWILLRCQCACDFLGQLHPPLAKDGPVPEMAAGWTPEMAAAWLLTELWERKADVWLKLLAVEWLGPFPFHGVKPVPEWM